MARLHTSDGDPSSSADGCLCIRRCRQRSKLLLQNLRVTAHMEVPLAVGLGIGPAAGGLNGWRSHVLRSRRVRKEKTP